MIIEAVFMFGLVNIVFEFVLLSMMSPRIRLRILGTHHYQLLMHFGFLLANLMIHWGTIIGTMSAILAFCSSILTVAMSQKIYGYVTDGRRYTLGFIKYSIAELK